MIKKLVLIGGVPGSGKTHVGKTIAQQTSAVYLDKDTVSQFFTEQLLVALGSNKDDRESEIYIHKVRPIEYETLMALALENISQASNHVICSAPFLYQYSSPTWLNKLSAQLKEMGAELILVWLSVDVATAKIRLTQRNTPRDAWKLANWHEYSINMQVTPPETVLPLMVIDSAYNPDVSLIHQIDPLVESLIAEYLDAAE